MYKRLHRLACLDDYTDPRPDDRPAMIRESVRLARSGPQPLEPGRARVNRSHQWRHAAQTLVK